MGKVVALLDKETGLGFRLAGIESQLTESVADLVSSVESLMRDPNVDIILLDQEMYREISEQARKRIEYSISPIIVPIPTVKILSGKAPTEEYLARLIQRAVGYQIKIRR